MIKRKDITTIVGKSLTLRRATKQDDERDWANGLWYLCHRGKVVASVRADHLFDDEGNYFTDLY